MELEGHLFLLREYLHHHPEWLKPVYICTARGKYDSITIPFIVHVRADSNYVYIYLHNEKHPLMISQTLTEFEKGLPRDLFQRVHRSHLINVYMVRSYFPDQKRVTLFSQSESVPMADIAKDAFRKRCRFLFGPLSEGGMEETAEHAPLMNAGVI